MDRIWQWAWDRYGARYSWATYAGAIPALLPVYLIPSLVVVICEESDRYVEAAGVTVIATLVLVYVMVPPGRGSSRLVDRWASGRGVDRGRALDATYAWGRGVIARSVGANAAVVGVLLVVVGVMAGASGAPLA